MTKVRRRWINLALKKANESDFEPYKHAAVLVRSSRLLGIGINKYKDGSLYDPIYKDRMLHAEVDVLSRFSPEEVKGCVLYVVGKSRSGNIVNSCPCELCSHYLRRYPLKAIYYLDKDTVREFVA